MVVPLFLYGRGTHFDDVAGCGFKRIDIVRFHSGLRDRMPFSGFPCGQGRYLYGLDQFSGFVLRFDP